MHNTYACSMFYFSQDLKFIFELRGDRKNVFELFDCCIISTYLDKTHSGGQLSDREKICISKDVDSYLHMKTTRCQKGAKVTI